MYQTPKKPHFVGPGLGNRCAWLPSVGPVVIVDVRGWTVGREFRSCVEAAGREHVGGDWHLGPCGYVIVEDGLVINIGGGCPGGAISVGLGVGLASFGL